MTGFALVELISSEFKEQRKEETGVVDSSREKGIADDFEFFLAVNGAFINGFWFDEFFELEGVLKFLPLLITSIISSFLPSFSS